MKKFSIIGVTSAAALAASLAAFASGSGAAPTVAPASATFSGLPTQGRAAEAGGLVSVSLSRGDQSPPNAEIVPNSARILSNDGVRTVGSVDSNGPAPCLFDVKTGAHPSVGVSCGTVAWQTQMLWWGGGLGIVPDDVTTVTFTMTDGTTVDQKVVGNLWHAPTEAATVTFTSAGESREFDLMPLSQLPKDQAIAADGTVGPAVVSAATSAN